MCHKTPSHVWQACLLAGRHALDTLGHSHSEKAYEEVMSNYFYSNRIPCRRQPAFYRTIDTQVVPVGVADIEVDHAVILELKAGHVKISEDHKNQLLRYMKAAVDSNSRVRKGGILLFDKTGQLQVWSCDISHIEALSDLQ